MSDPATLDRDALSSPADLSSRGAELPLASLEQRVGRLEEAVGALQDTALMEERLLERLREREPPQLKIGPAPRATDKVTAERPTGETMPLPDVPVRPAAPPLSGLTEFRAMARMFFDMHYHVAWSTRILVLLFIPLIWTSELWFPPAWVPLVGVIFDKTFDIILAFLLYKVLAGEARRYVRSQALLQDDQMTG